MEFKGRRPIYTGVREITEENVARVIEKAMDVHEFNKIEVIYLKNYEKGIHPILYREKPIRDDINNKVVVNVASQITEFKLSRSLGNPISYVQRSMNEDGIGDEEDYGIELLNEMLFEENKQGKDQQLGKDVIVDGIGYRGVFPKKKMTGKSVFSLVNFDPTCTFIVRSSDMYHRPMLACTYWIEERDEINVKHFTAYTEDKVYEFEDTPNSKITVSKNGIGMIPIVEYIYDYERMGSFERCLTEMDALDVVESDRVNGLAQTVQSFIWFNNVDIDKDTFAELKALGGIATSSRDGVNASVEYLSAQLNQAEIQQLSDNLYGRILTKCAVPSRGESSGNATGQSAMLSGGWQEADEAANRMELNFMTGERETIEIIIAIVKKAGVEGMENIHPSDIDVKFSRNNVSNLISKTQALLNLLNAGVHPLRAFEKVSLFEDSQTVWNDSKPYLEKWLTNNEAETINTGLDQNLNDPATVTEEQNEHQSFVNGS